LIEPFLSSLSSSLERTSKLKIKRKGERGSPCLSPISGEKLPKGLPFNKMEKDAIEMHILTPSNPLRAETQLFQNS
jgi:hypothetical protein